MKQRSSARADAGIGAAAGVAAAAVAAGVTATGIAAAAVLIAAAGGTGDSGFLAAGIAAGVADEIREGNAVDRTGIAGHRISS